MTDTANANLAAHLLAAFPSTGRGATAVRTAGSEPPLHYTWDDLDRGSAMIANLFENLRLPPGSRIVVQTDKSVEALMLYLAVLRAGHVHVPLNTAYQKAEVEYFIGSAEPAVVVCAPANFPWVSRLAFAAGTRNVFTLGEHRDGTLLERAAQMPDVQQPVPKEDDDLASIIYTSGTTGRSKGAMLTHANLRSNAEVLKTFWDWRPGDVLIHALPIFHVHGLFVAIHGALLNGSPMIWLNRFDPKVTVAELPHATVFMGVPTLYVRMLAEPALTPAQAGTMRLFISGSAPLLVETFDAWRERTGHTILERYGMSETVMLTSNPCKPTDGHAGERRRGTVGPALPGVGLRVVDDLGEAVRAGDIGHIQVKGPNVFAGYWRMPERTQEEFTPDGWFRTGDVGTMAEDGYVTIVGRSKDLVITGGYNVYPAEVEGYLNELPGVLESAVIGVPHADFGEAVVAVVVPRDAKTPPQEAALIQELKQRIAGFKVPKRIVVAAELPRNTMGKVQKNMLRDRHAAMFAGAT